MLHYEGQTSRDITPTGAGKWVKENADAHEKWNFLNDDGICYGYVQNKGHFHIERLEGVSSTAEDTNAVMVIWCAPITSGKTVIVGWYDNATVYRFAEALKELFQFEASINWFNNAIEIEGETWDTAVKLPYLYNQVDDYKKAIVAAKKLLDYPQGKQDEIRDEIYSVIADNYMYQGELEEGIKWLDKVLEESTDSK